MSLRWHDRTFAELSTTELYAIIALRERTFVVEQACPFLECDDHDQVARHLWADPGDPAVIQAYLRILPAGDKYAEAALGRVIVAPAARGSGLGYELMRRGLAAVGPVAVRISAQAHLERFYNQVGFARAGENYDEDGIPHLEMLRPAPPRQA